MKSLIRRCDHGYHIAWQSWPRLPVITDKLTEAEAQAKHYGKILKDRYGLPRITCFAVVALWLERIVYIEVTDKTM